MPNFTQSRATTADAIKAADHYDYTMHDGYKLILVRGEDAAEEEDDALGVHHRHSVPLTQPTSVTQPVARL